MSKKAKVLTHGDTKLILAVIASKSHAERNRAIFMVGLLAGLRACELSALTICSVLDGNNNILDRLVLAKNQTKGDKRRTIPISSKLAKELRLYIASLHPRAVQPERPLFESQKGGRFMPHGIVMLFQRLYKDAGIVGASSHSTRISFCNNLISNAISVAVVRDLMGHKSISTTNGYLITGEYQLRNAVNLL